MWRLSASILLALTVCHAAEDTPNYRLDASILDVNHYDLYIRNIDENSETFTGQVNINITLKKGTEIQLHKQNINLETPIKLGDIECTIEKEDDSVTQITHLNCPNATAGSYILTINYRGNILTGDMAGFYKSTYQDGGADKTLLATQFEPTSARRMFPCFDEPSFKATFKITVEHDPKYTALSNDLQAKQFSNGKNKTVTEFIETPKMSTYLVALVLAEFESAGDSKLYKVWSRPEAIKYTKTAANNVDKLINKLSEFMNIPYAELGIKKSDQAAIPDFAAGAMENWGLITYRESDLLDEAEKTTAAGKQKVITVVAHELAHQWFGDFATLKWWGETWLNEGFATFFQYHISDLLQDDFDLDKQFLVEVVQAVLISDSVSTVQALVTKEENVTTLAEITAKFGDISYSKGGSILRMIRSVLGDTKFKSALTTYLKAHDHQTVTHDDLIKVLGDDKEKFRKWFEQPGYPLVTVTLSGNNLTLQQVHYTTVSTGQLWDIPITYVTSNDTTKPSGVKWLSTANMTLQMAEEIKWAIVNWEQAGYYRVNYDSKLFDAIVEVLQSDSSKINEFNRAQLIDDTFNLAITGHTTYKQAFDLINYLTNETVYTPWASTFNAISALLQKIDNDDIVSNIQQRLLDLMEHVIVIPANATDLPFKSHIDTILGVAILKNACSFGHSKCTSFAQKVFDGYTKDKNIDNNYRAFGLCTALSTSAKQQETWDKLWKAFGTAVTSHEKDDILAALGCSSDKTVLTGYLKKSINATSGIRKQDAFNVFKAVLKGRRVGVEAALDFMINNIEDIQKYYKGMAALGDMVTGIAKLLVNKDDVSKLKTFLKESKIPEIQLVAQEAQEAADKNVKWSEEKLGELEDLFLSKPGAANSITITLTLLISAALLALKI